MTALGLAFADQIVATTALVPLPLPLSVPGPAPVPVRRDGCDFSGDGRIVDGCAADRSALACPLFYAAILACAVLVVAVAMVGLFRMVSMRAARRA